MTLKNRQHKARKHQIIDSRGWDSEELKSWYEEDAKLVFPYSQGACKAYRAWKNSTGDEVLMDDFVWESEAHDFIEAFRSVGIETFVVTNSSTVLMENLHWFAAEGCTMEGHCTVSRMSDRFGEETEEQIMGIRFRVN